MDGHTKKKRKGEKINRHRRKNKENEKIPKKWNCASHIKYRSIIYDIEQTKIIGFPTEYGNKWTFPCTNKQKTKPPANYFFLIQETRRPKANNNKNINNNKRRQYIYIYIYIFHMYVPKSGNVNLGKV